MTPLHFLVDIDAFFASVEQLDDPGLRGKPVIVGGRPGTRGVVSTCSYEARSYGVRSAMPIAEASRLCPDAVFMPVRMERYKEVSEAVFSVFDRFSPEVLPVSIDEAFLDMTGTERLLGPPSESARALKEAVKRETGLNISVGAATNRFVAKMACGASKPDGLIVVGPGEEAEFMEGMPLERLWGAGQKTQERLRELNIRSMAELRSYAPELLKGLFGQAMGGFLASACLGRDPGIHEGPSSERSFSTERTFEADIHDEETLETILLEMSRELMYGLYRRSLRARTVQVKMRYADFRTSTARRSRESAFLSTDELFAASAALLRERREGRMPLRLLGLGLSSLDDSGTVQGELFGEAGPRRAAVERAAFSIEERGRGRLRKARNLKPPDDQG